MAPLRIVAVGDSYASGEGAPGPAWIDSSCHRSALAGPQDAAARLNVFPQSFMSFACSGATTSSLLGLGRDLEGKPLPSQLSRLPVGPIDALTISIGGNDIGFANIVTTCVNTSPDIAPGCVALDASVSSALGDLPAALRRVFAAVPARVSNVFVTEYPDPTTGALNALCGTLLSPAFHGLQGINGDEAAWASSRVVARLNATLKAAVDAANDRLSEPHPVFHFVTGISFRFAGHGYCTGGGSPVPWAWPNPRLIATPVDSLTRQGDVNGTMHPNDLGQQAIGEVLAAAMSFLVKPPRLQVIPSATPVIGVPVQLTVQVSTAAGTPVPRADVRIDGTLAGTTDQKGKLTLTRTFTSAGDHTATVDHNPYPVVSTSFAVNSYTVTSNPSPIPVDTAVPLSLRATDQSNQLVPGTFTLTSDTGTVSIRSGASATVTLGMRYEHETELDDDGKPVTTRIPICPDIVFQPDNSVLEPRDVSDLDDCP